MVYTTRIMAVQLETGGRENGVIDIPLGVPGCVKNTSKT